MINKYDPTTDTFYPFNPLTAGREKSINGKKDTSPVKMVSTGRNKKTNEQNIVEIPKYLLPTYLKMGYMYVEEYKRMTKTALMIKMYSPSGNPLDVYPEQIEELTKNGWKTEKDYHASLDPKAIDAEEIKEDDTSTVRRGRPPKVE